MNRALQQDGSLDCKRMGSWGTLPYTQDPSHTEKKRDGWFDSTASSGRALEALVWLFESTDEPEVLEAAWHIAEHHLKYSTNNTYSLLPVKIFIGEIFS